MLKSMGSQRVGHNWATEVNWKQPSLKTKTNLDLYCLPISNFHFPRWQFQAANVTYRRWHSEALHTSISGEKFTTVPQRSGNLGHVLEKGYDSWWFFFFFFFWDLWLWIFFWHFFFKFYFIFKLYITVLVLPNIKMNPPQVYMCSPSWTLLPPPSPFHPSLRKKGYHPAMTSSVIPFSSCPHPSQHQGLFQ